MVPINIPNGSTNIAPHKTQREPQGLFQRHPRCWGWPAPRIPTPVGDTSAVHKNITAGSYGPPPIMSSPTLTTPATSHPTTWYLCPGCLWSLQGSSFQLPPSFPCLGIITRLWSRSVGIRPKLSWLVLGSSPAVAPWPGYPWSLLVCSQNCPPPLCHQHTMDEWLKGVHTGDLELEGVPLYHMLSCPGGTLGSHPYLYARSGLTTPIPTPIWWPSGGIS